MKFTCEKLSYKSVSLDDVYIEGALHKTKLILQQAQAKAREGRIAVQGKADLSSDGLPFSAVFSMEEVPGEVFCQWLSVPPDLITGLFNSEGVLKGEAQPPGYWKESLDGRFSINGVNGTIQRYDFLAKLLTLVNFTQWAKVRLSDLNLKGIPFRSIKGSFVVNHGVLKTEDLCIDSSVALADISGEYVFLNDWLNIQLILSPLEQLGLMVDMLPIVGSVITGPHGNVVMFVYNIQGPFKSPEVQLIPLKGFSDRIGVPLQELNNWFQSLQKRLSTED